MEGTQIPGYNLEKCGDYYYIQHSPDQPSAPNTPDIHQLPSTTAMLEAVSVPSLRSKTPDCHSQYVVKGRGHRRSTSACITSSVIMSVSQGNIGGKRRGSVSTAPFPNSDFTSSASLCKHAYSTGVHMVCTHAHFSLKCMCNIIHVQCSCISAIKLGDWG